MRIVNFSVAAAVFSAIGVLAAQPAAEKCPPGDSAHAYAAAMQESLARQRAALQKQTGQPRSGGFFLLAPPATMGANTPAPPIAPAVPDCEPLPPSEVDSLVEQAAKREDLDQALLRGVMQQESGFRPCAVSPKGAMGLMQLMPATAVQFDVPNPFDPSANLEAGAKFLKDLLVRYGGDVPRALGAYNAGSSRVDAAAGVPEIPETQDYVNRILSLLPVKK